MKLYRVLKLIVEYLDILQLELNGRNGCACDIGWMGEKCDTCVPYWSCPYKITDPNDVAGIAENGLACEEPNQCWCRIGSTIYLTDKAGKCLCNTYSINGYSQQPAVNWGPPKTTTQWRP